MVPAEQVARAAQVVPVARAVLAARAARCSARMADAYANPVMVDALILGREGTTSFPRPDA